MRQPYVDNYERIEAAGILAADEKLYDYSDDERKDAYDDLFESANEFLQQQAKAQGFPPCFFYFRRDDSVNAFAISQKKYKRIAFTHGMVEALYDYFEQKEDLLQEAEFSDLHNVLAPYQNPYSYNFFQFWQMFTTYHEYAHLVQRGRNSEFSYAEFDSGKPGDILESHALELDADFLAASQLAINILEEMRDSAGNLKRDPGDLQVLCSIALASAFIFFMKTAGGLKGLYFQENEHPHPYVRIAFLSNIMLDTIQKNAPDLPFDSRACVNRALDIAEKIMDGDYKDPAQTFKAEFGKHFDPIINHLVGVVEKMKTMPNLCYNLPPDRLP